MLLVSHKMTFLENEAALLCVTMRKRSRAMTSTMSDIKFLSKRHSVENKFLWQELQVSLSRKRGPPPPPPAPPAFYMKFNVGSMAYTIVKKKKGVFMFWKSYIHIYDI